MESLKEEVIFDPYLPEKWPNPIPAYLTLLKDHPVYYLEKRDLWILSRYDDVMGALRDWKTYSSGAGGNTLEEVPERVGNTLGTTDPPFHNQLRAVISGVFTPRYVASLEENMRKIVRELIDNIKDKHTFDANGEFATLYTARVVGKMIGVPDEDLKFFVETVDSAGSLTEEEKDDPENIKKMVRTMVGYCEKLVQKKLENPGDDIISKLLSANLEGKQMGVKEISLMSVTLIGAAFQSTSMAIACSLVTLYKNQKQLAEVRANPSLIPNMIEEALRYDGSTIGFKRTATKDIEIHGQKIPEGSRVFLLFGAANHDENYFPNPSEFDIHRENNKHLGFGWGVHHCLGAPIARQMLRIAYEELLPVLGDFEIDFERVEYGGQPQFRGYRVLPVSF
jgi:cytochrome P450